jgi:predicted PolB exonuclease-like 3'-5' exonuclease
MNIFSQPLLVFDLETVPDVETTRKLYDLPADLPPEQVMEVLAYKRLEKTGSTFAPLYLQQIIIASVLFADKDRLVLYSLADGLDNEPLIIKQFFDGIEKYTPRLISWNGSGFDLPVLHYRALKHRLAAPRYWDTGERDKEFKYNNYLSRYHNRHIDLMDVLNLYQARGQAPMDEIAQLLGFPGKQVLHGSAVAQAYSEGRLLEIRQYCEMDVLNTYLIYLRFEEMRGLLSKEAYDYECQRVRRMLAAKPPETHPHFHNFLAQWPET